MTLPPSDGGINRLIALRDFGEGQATRKLKELVRAYETLSLDVVRTMVRIKASCLLVQLCGIRPNPNPVFG